MKTGLFLAAPEACYLSLLTHHVLEKGTVRYTVEVPVLGADGDRGVSELFYGALDPVYGDYIPYLCTVLDVAARRDVAREEGEPLAEI